MPGRKAAMKARAGELRRGARAAKNGAEGERAVVVQIVASPRHVRPSP